ncbi:MAG: RHS repeat domain-containing protein [Paracoccaceae bacterium]
MKKIPFYITTHLVSAFCFAFPISQANAQVSDTEVNQEAIDEFGLDRKTGRFSWSSGDIIAIGGDSSRISMSVTGVRNPARATRIWPLESYLLQLNQPRLLSEPKPDRNSPIPGAIILNAFDHTVETPFGSETFTCGTSCGSEYFTDSTLAETATGHLYTSPGGVEVHFEEYSTHVRHPDGRETTYRTGRYQKNNFGFMIKHSAGGFQAVNLAVDYCNPDAAASCTGLDQIRTANFEAPSIGVRHIVDSAGQITKLRWDDKSAKLYKRPQGAPASLWIESVEERYPTGITLPGSTSEDITINYHPIDPSLNTHDDIVVSSIKKSGVTATYEYTRFFPYGVAEHQPSASETLENMTGTGSLIYTAQLDCVSGDAFACNDLDEMLAVIQYLQSMAELEASLMPTPPELLEPFESGSLGPNTYELTIARSIAGQPAGTSFTIKPLGTYGQKRRRLVHMIDELGQKTEYHHNIYEELAGIIYPEGNSVLNGYGARANLTSSAIIPKDGLANPILETTYTYPLTCDNIPKARCNKPLTMTDPNGNVTEYTYNDRGQVLTETRPAPTPGAARPTLIQTYAMRTAYIKNPSGSPVPAGPPISLLTSSYTCISSVICSVSTPAVDKVVTQYDYGPTSGLNNLLLRGFTVTAANELGQIETLRTCYQYNYFGEKIAETQPKAGLTSCPG